MEREFITHHIKKDYSEIEHLTASSAKKYSQDYSKHLMEHSESSRSARRLHYSATKSPGACQTQRSEIANRVF